MLENKTEKNQNAIKKSGLNSNKIFEKITFANMERKKRYTIIRTLAEGTKAASLPPLSKHNKDKRVRWTT